MSLLNSPETISNGSITNLRLDKIAIRSLWKVKCLLSVNKSMRKIGSSLTVRTSTPRSNKNLLIDPKKELRLKTLSKKRRIMNMIITNMKRLIFPNNQ